MKKIILLALTALMMVGCYQAKANHDKQMELVGDYRIKTIVYQGCEYVVIESHYHQSTVITHKGNCRYCKERRQKELNYIVEQLKEK